MHTKNEKVTITWCDNGMVDGRFAQGLSSVLLLAKQYNIEIDTVTRILGNQIGRQRQTAFDQWADNLTSDWLFWIDSDIAIDIEVLLKLWQVADKVTHPVVVGTYFITHNPESPVMTPTPCIFLQHEDGKNYVPVSPLPENEVIKIDSAGFGIVLMHRSIVEKVRSVSNGYSVFAEIPGIGNDFVSEDVAFFQKLSRAKIPAYAHTGAVAGHMKKFNYDINYYNLFNAAIGTGLLTENG